MPCKHLAAQCNSQHESDCCFAMKGIIQHVLALHLPASLCIRYRTSGLKTREETSCPRIDDSVSNIPKLTNTDHQAWWPLVFPLVTPDITSHVIASMFAACLIQSSFHHNLTQSGHPPAGWSGDNARIVIICIKRRKDQHENRKRPWDKVLRVSSDGLLCRSRISHHITLLPSIYLVIAKRSVRKSLILASAVSVLC